MRKEQEVFEELATLCRSKGYAHVIAFFSLRDNLVAYKDELKGSDYSRLFSWDRLIRTEISTLVGLLVRGPIDLSIPSGEQFAKMAQQTEDLLKELHVSMMEPFNEIFKEALADPNHPNPFTNAEAMREPIFYGAESAYTFQYRDIAPQKYARDEIWFSKNKEFSISEARSVVIAISDFLSRKAPEVLVAAVKAKAEILAVLPAFEFLASDLAPLCGLSTQQVSKILEAFVFPDNGNPTFTSLTEFNATNAYPILKSEGEKFILFQYASLTEALYDTPYYWLSADGAYCDTAMAHRGLFAEEFSNARLRKVFGEAHVYTNVDIWQSKSKKAGEIDVLVLFGDRAIVLQAKSKKLTLAARRGNDLQLKADFKAAVQDAADQALKCSDYLSKNFVLTDVKGETIALPSKLKKIHPVCVVSDHFPSLTFQAQNFLKAAGTEVIEKPVVCDVFWLDVVTEMLESPLRLLSYLGLRSLAGDNVLISHENVALGYHLKQNLWLGKADLMLLHDDLSADLDVAMAVRREGLNGQRTPPGILTLLRDTRVGQIITEIEERSEPALIGLGLDLLKLNGETVRNVSEAIDKIAKIAAKDHRQHDVTVGIGKGATGLTVHSNELPTDEAIRKLEKHCELRKYSQKAPQWHGLSVRPGDAALRFGVMLDYPWKEDAKLAALVDEMPDPLPAKKLPEMIRKLAPKRKIGRNESCPCGSGLKYKKCCLNKLR